MYANVAQENFFFLIEVMSKYQMCLTHRSGESPGTSLTKVDYKMGWWKIPNCCFSRFWSSSDHFIVILFWHFIATSREPAAIHYKICAQLHPLNSKGDWNRLWSCQVAFCTAYVCPAYHIIDLFFSTTHRIMCVTFSSPESSRFFLHYIHTAAHSHVSWQLTALHVRMGPFMLLLGEALRPPPNPQPPPPACFIQTLS